LTVGGKVVLITGASQGIGQACAISFGRRGALLSLAARTPLTLPDALCTACDLTSEADRETLVRQTIQHFGRIDILVNNAGHGLYGPTAQATATDMRNLFELNVFAAVSMIQLVLPGMLAQGSGHVVNVSSIAAEIALPWMTMYSASKAALSAVSCGLRRELLNTAVQVTDVLPGYVKTGFHAAATGTPPSGVVKLRARAISPEQCAEAIVKGVERGARRVVTPASGRLAILAEHLLPRVVDSPLSKMNR